MRSRPLMTLRLNTAPTQNVGAGPHGTRVTFPITGGSFEGDGEAFGADSARLRRTRSQAVIAFHFR